MAIAFFYAFGTIVGGFGGPLLFGALIASGEAENIFLGYLLGAVLMIAGGIVQATMGVEAARRDLGDMAPPLSAQAAELEEPGEEADRYTIGREEPRTGEPARFEKDEPASPRGPSVTEHGELKRNELSEMLGCKYWGPGRFARALKIGVDEGRFRRVRRGVYGRA